MEKSSENENKSMQNEGCETIMNETKFANDVIEDNIENPNLQIKGSVVSKNDEEEIFKNFELLHSQRKKWRLHNNITLFLFF
jgi:hypothetical protein